MGCELKVLEILGTADLALSGPEIRKRGKLLAQEFFDAIGALYDQGIVGTGGNCLYWILTDENSQPPPLKSRPRQHRPVRVREQVRAVSFAGGASGETASLFGGGDGGGGDHHAASAVKGRGRRGA